MTRSSTAPQCGQVPHVGRDQHSLGFEQQLRDRLRLAAGPAPAVRHPDGVQDRLDPGGLVPPAGGEDDREGQAVGVGDEVGLGPAPAPGRPEGVVGRLSGRGFPPAAPAAERLVG